MMASPCSPLLLILKVDSRIMIDRGEFNNCLPSQAANFDHVQLTSSD